MAVDEAILDAVTEGLAPPTLRLYRWEAPAISLGRFQDELRGVDIAACAEQGVDLVKRPTGGRGVLHGTDQTVGIALPIAYLGAPGPVVAESYRVLSRGFREGLTVLGILSEGAACERRTARGGDCFAVRSESDLLSSGEKLAGSAQCRRNGTLLQQTSLRHRPPRISPERLFRGPVAPAYYPLAAVSEEDLARGIAEGFQIALGIEMEPGELSDWEYERAGCLLERYRPLAVR
jgi:lipoate-protein ligase A